MTSPILTQVLDTAGQGKVGVVTLNEPDKLNGITLAMSHALTRVLHEWEADASIVAVVMRGAGERAFSAGGDLQGLYQSMVDNTTGDAWNNPYTKEFFDVEYRLDYQIHTYPKPIVCWASGIVMGGGVGLMMGASHRVVTTTTRFAMPEISIGLFPDVGGTWMLSRLPDGMGNFLALTGAQLGASDCEFLGLADHIAEADALEDILAGMQAHNWSGSVADHDTFLRQLLDSHRPGDLAAGPLQIHQAHIRRVASGRSLTRIDHDLRQLAEHDDAWLQRAVRTYMAGSPGSARLSFTLLHKVRLMSLADVFRLEYIVSQHCGAHGDLQEGIRALIIDKDKTPAWQPASLAQATPEWVQRFFVPPWPDTQAHPLADLGN